MLFAISLSIFEMDKSVNRCCNIPVLNQFLICCVKIIEKLHSNVAELIGIVTEI